MKEQLSHQLMLSAWKVAEITSASAELLVSSEPVSWNWLFSFVLLTSNSVLLTPIPIALWYQAWCLSGSCVRILVRRKWVERRRTRRAAHLRLKTPDSQWFVSDPVLHAQSGSYLDKVGLLFINHQSNCAAGALSNIKRDEDHPGSEITGINQRTCRLSGIFSQHSRFYLWI